MRNRLSTLYLTGYLFGAIMLFCLGVIVCNPRLQKVTLHTENAFSLANGWYMNSGGVRSAVTFPLKLKQPDDSVTIYYQIPGEIGENRCIGFYLEQTLVSVTAGNAQVYSYQAGNTPRWLKSAGKFWHIVSLPNLGSGDMVCVTLTPDYPGQPVYISSPLIGTRAGIQNYISRRGTPLAIIASVIILLGFILILVSVLFYKQFKDDHSVLFLGLISILCGLWQMEQTGMLQLLSGNTVLHWFLDYVIMIFIPVVLVNLVEELSDVKNDIGLKICYASAAAAAVVSFVLQVAGIVSLAMSQLYVIGVLAAICGYLLYFFYHEYHCNNNRRLSHMLPVLVIITVGIVTEIGYFFFNARSTAVWLGITMLLVFVYIGYRMYLITAKRFREVSKMEMYHKLAFTDMPTGVASRTAYYTFVEHYTLPAEQSAPDRYVIYIFDMNNLKQINDKWGHLVGDEAIRAFCGCAREAFDRIGTVYRVGGDEFAVLCKNHTEQDCIRCERLFNDLVIANQSSPHPFTVAYGSVWFTPRCKNDFYAAQREADERMYIMKRRSKISRS